MTMISVLTTKSFLLSKNSVKVNATASCPIHLWKVPKFFGLEINCQDFRNILF